MDCYNNKKIAMHDSVLLPLSFGQKERNDLSLDYRSQFILHVRDSQYKGSWKKMISWINEDGSKDQKARDIKIINNLMAIERKHNLNLGDLLREWVPLEDE